LEKSNIVKNYVKTIKVYKEKHSPGPKMESSG
jgi:hypothetical protein